MVSLDKDLYGLWEGGLQNCGLVYLVVLVASS